MSDKQLFTVTNLRKDARMLPSFFNMKKTHENKIQLVKPFIIYIVISCFEFRIFFYMA